MDGNLPAHQVGSSETVGMDDNFLAPQASSDEFRLQQDKHQYLIAQQTIEANLQNQREIRAHFGELAKQDKRNGMTVAVLFLLLFFSFGFYALSQGKESLLSELLKVFIGAFGGGGIGYIFGVRSSRKPPNTN